MKSATRQNSKGRTPPRRAAFLSVAKRLSKIHRFFWIPCGALFLTAGLTAVRGAEISDVVIDTSRDHLLLSVKIRDIGSGEVNASPVEAASATIIFSIALYEVKPFWFDKKMAHHTATNTIMRDSNKNEYRLLRSWDSGPPLKVDALNQTRLLMAEISKLRVMPLAGLEKGRTYQIRVRAVCQDKNAFIFSPAECFKTDWHTVDFIF
ncbi:MAG: DUF4390 domain-containing protein [Desulfobacterales bacterium]|jgi:hypothetical protein